MKQVTIEIEDDDVVVVLHRPEGYEDIHPFLLAEDAVPPPFQFDLPWLDHYNEEWEQP